MSTASALYEYAAQTDDELSFREGDEMLIFDKTEPDWWLVKASGRVGLVPATYLEEVRIIQTMLSD